MEQTFAPAHTAGRRGDARAPAAAPAELWLADIAVATQPGWIETHSAWLTSEERERLARFTRPQRRAQFLAGHILLRRLVAACWRIDPRDVQVATRADGSPEVLVPAGVQCSLAHTGRWVAALVQPGEADDWRPGVDIESMRSDRPIEAIVKVACGIDAGSREEAYRAWAQHEAQIKAFVLERRQASRSSVDEALSNPASEGVEELRAMLGGFDDEMKRKRRNSEG